MVRELVVSGHVDVVCKCFEGLNRMGHDEALAHVALAIAKTGRPDIIAAVSHRPGSSSCLIWQLPAARPPGQHACLTQLSSLTHS